MKNNGEIPTSQKIIGATGGSKEGQKAILMLYGMCEEVQVWSKDGRYFASGAAAKRLCKGQDYMPIILRGSDGKRYGLKQLARMCVRH